MVHNVDPVKVGQRVGLYVDPDDIQIMRKSEMSPEPGSYGIKKIAGADDEEASSETSETDGGADV